MHRKGILPTIKSTTTLGIYCSLGRGWGQAPWRIMNTTCQTNSSKMNHESLLDRARTKGRISLSSVCETDFTMEFLRKDPSVHRWEATVQHQGNVDTGSSVKRQDQKSANFRTEVFLRKSQERFIRLGHQDTHARGRQKKALEQEINSKHERKRET